ncbi:trace amine-associated receptor 9-like [Patiria miniata]|uniref:G-protein coupled receptors family 1 profile domain-containing protein n=1 Tax=Patiria miniata TaxID=46514 RepID=A0A914BSC8_PATMI|nr:trace amine-associated receptor 9-like [Patiria miniata]
MSLRQAVHLLNQLQLGESIVGFIGNALVCLTILKTKALHNVTNYMLFNLAVADFIVSIEGILEQSVENHRRGIGIFGYCTPSFIYNFNVYFIFSYFQKVSFANSVFALTLATFERYIGIIKPLHYFTFFTKRRLISMLLFMWLAPYLTEAFSPIFYITAYEADNCTVPSAEKYPITRATGIVRLFFVFIIPSIALAYMYARILINLKRGARHLENQGIQGPQSQELHQAHKKVTKSLLLVIAAFFILILPSQILRNVIVYLNVFDGDYYAAELVSNLIACLSSMNSAINPIMYGLSYSQLRRACIAMLCPFDRCKRSNHVTQVSI